MSKFHLETPFTYSAWLFFSAAASVDAAPPRFPAATAAARSACRARSRSLSCAVRSPRLGMASSRCFTRKSGFFASFRNLCSSSFAALGRRLGSFCRHTETKSRSPRVKWCPVSACSASSCGGGFCRVMSRTFMGGYLAKGAWPWQSSNTVIPRLQMSAWKS